MTELLNHLRGDCTQNGLPTAGPDGIDCLAKENETLTAEVKRLRKQVGRLQRELAEANGTIADLQVYCQRQHDRIDQQQQYIATLLKRIDELESARLKFETPHQ